MKIKILIQKKNEKRLENMKIHTRYFGENSSWFNDNKYGKKYKEILFEFKKHQK